MKFSKLTSAKFVEGYSIRLSFSDGATAVVDFEKELTGGIFEALRDPAFFRSFSFQAQFGTIEWDNGADFAPEFLYEMARDCGQQSAGFDVALRRKSA